MDFKLIYLFANSLFFFAIQSIVLKILYYKIQNEILSTTAPLIFLFLGLAKGYGGKESAESDSLIKIRVLDSYFKALLCGSLLIAYASYYFLIFDIIKFSNLNKFRMSEEVIMAIHAAFYSLLLYLFSFYSGRESKYLFILYGKVADGFKLSLTYAGSLVSSVLFYFYTYKNWNVIQFIQLTYFLSFFMTFFYILSIRRELVFKNSFRFLAVGFLVFILNFFYLPKALRISEPFSLNRQAYVFKGLVAQEIKYFSTMSEFQKIEVLDFSSEGDGRKFELYLDGSFQFDSDGENLYHTPFVEPAANFADFNKIENPKVLILGGGDGLLARTIKQKYRNFQIDLVELDPAMIEMGKTTFSKLNKKALLDDINVIIADAFVYLRNNKKKYDFVFADFPDPHAVVLSKLYSYEIYKFIIRSLSPNGLLVFDYPQKEDDNIITTTLFAAGFKNVFSYGFGHRFILATPLLSDIENFDASKYQIKTLTPVVDFHRVNSILNPQFMLFY